MTVDQRIWLVCALGGALVLVGCLVPTIEVAQEAIVGAGDAQSAGALLRGSHTVLILAAAALSIAFVVETVRIGDDLQWGDAGLYACDEPLEQCVPFIARATRDVQDEIRQKPEARRPGFELLAEDGYRARGKTGWSLILWSSIVLACVTVYRAFLLILRPLWASVALGVLALLTLAYLFLKALEGLE